MGRHSSGGTRRWRLPAAASLLVAVVVLVVATRWSPDPSASAQPRAATVPTSGSRAAGGTTTAAADPCRHGFGDQQVAGTARPDTADVGDSDFAPETRVGLVAPGLCLDWSYELSTPGWSVTRVQVLAHQRGVDLTSALSADHEGTALFVPLTGCVRVTWSFSLAGPEGRTGTWTARSVHGQDCPRYHGVG